MYLNFISDDELLTAFTQYKMISKPFDDFLLSLKHPIQNDTFSSYDHIMSSTKAHIFSMEMTELTDHAPFSSLLEHLF